MRSSFALSSADDAPRNDAYISHLGRLVRMRANRCKSGSEEKEGVGEQKKVCVDGERKELSKQYSYNWGLEGAVYPSSCDTFNRRRCHIQHNFDEAVGAQ